MPPEATCVPPCCAPRRRGPPSSVGRCCWSERLENNGVVSSLLAPYTILSPFNKHLLVSLQRDLKGMYECKHLYDVHICGDLFSATCNKRHSPQAVGKLRREARASRGGLAVSDFIGARSSTDSLSVISHQSSVISHKEDKREVTSHSSKI